MNIPFAVSGTLNAGTVVALRSVKSVLNTIYVTKITLSIITHANGKLVQVQDTTGTPVVFAKHIDATAAAGVPSVVTWDFGKEGLPISLGKNLTCVSESGGPVGYIYAEGIEVEG